MLLKVLNPDARTTLLLDTDPQLTLQDVGGIPLAFPIGSMPWNRLLGMHAHFTLETAHTHRVGSQRTSFLLLRIEP